MKKPLIGLVCSVLLWVGMGFPTQAQIVEKGVEASFFEEPHKMGVTDGTKIKTVDSSVAVQHSFNHREQVIAGGVFMFCLALILISVNNYNPQKK